MTDSQAKGTAAKRQDPQESSAPLRTEHPAMLFLRNGGIALAYWGFSHLVWLFFREFGMLPAPIWPAAAVALTAALGLGWRAAPGLYIGAVLANAVSLGAPLPIALGIGLMNTAGPILAAFLLQRHATTTPPFYQVRDVFLFVGLGVVLHAALTASGGVASLLIGAYLPLADVASAWLRWWIAHASGAMLFAPALLLVWYDPKPRLAQGDGREFLAVSLVGLVSTAIIFFGLSGPTHSAVALPLLLFAPLAWLAVRFSQREPAVVLPLIIAIAAVATVMGLGPFHLAGNVYPLVALGVMILTFALTNLLLGALVAERRHTESDLNLAASVFHSTLEGIIITDAKGVILSVNPAFTEITGFSAEEALGKTPALLKSYHHDESFYQELWEALRTERRWQGEIWNRCKDGSIFVAHESISAVSGADGQAVRFVSVFNDVTELRRKEERIRHMAYHDALTGLPNRQLLRDRLEQALNQARRNQHQVAVMFLDLDRFKLINDSLGHEVGDKLLKEVAQRLSAVMRRSDTVARLGGDEFVALIEKPGSLHDLVLVADRIIEVLVAPMVLDGNKVHITTSIGVSVFPQDGDEPNELMKNADTAMYAAKNSGRNACHFFDHSMNSRMIERLRLEAELRQAVSTGAFEMVFQPQINLADSRLVGVEAFLRWRHPERGLLPPDQFLPLAEEAGLGGQLGETALARALAEAARWPDEGLGPLPISVNVSGRQLRRDDFPDQVKAKLQEWNIPPERLEIELSEQTVMNDPESISECLSRLRCMGVRIAIDDFGTGCSSLADLRHLPIDTLKIDRLFIATLDATTEDAEIVRAVIALGRALGQRVVAEGVETPAQGAALKAWGCQVAQGYLYARPLGAESFIDWGRSHLGATR